MAKLKEDAEITEKDLRDYVWNYFQVHAAQRLTTFNFYIALSSAVTTGLFATFNQTFRVPLLGVVLGVLLITFSFVFWKLDQRNRYLVKNSEEGLVSLEECVVTGNSTLDRTKVFSNERQNTGAQRSRMNAVMNLRAYPYSYSWCFNIVFVLFAFLGLAGGTISAAFAFGLMDWPSPPPASGK